MKKWQRSTVNGRIPAEWLSIITAARVKQEGQRFAV